MKIKKKKKKKKLKKKKKKKKVNKIVIIPKYSSKLEHIIYLYII